MAKAVKLADIAERLSVSTVTVSKALSGQKGVSEEMYLKKSFCRGYSLTAPLDFHLCAEDMPHPCR